MVCVVCGSTHGHCPECGEVYQHGTVGYCPKPACQAVNAPIDCACGYVVSRDADGVLDQDMNLLPFIEGRAA